MNASTGELSSVQPVDSSPSAQEAADVQDVYGAPSIEEPMVQDDAEVEVDVEAQTMVVSTSAPSTQGAQDSEFGAPGAPQWRSLHQPPQAGSFQEAIVDGTAETAAVSGEAVSPYAFYSDEAGGDRRRNGRDRSRLRRCRQPLRLLQRRGRERQRSDGGLRVGLRGGPGCRGP